MNIAVLGAGAMGSWFGGLLANQGNDVQLLTTNAEHRNAITSNGLVLSSPDGEQTVSVTADAPEKIKTPVNLMLVMTKSFQTSDAMASIAHALDTNTQVISLQNGLGNDGNIAKYVSQDRIWVGVSMLPIDKLAPGIVACKGHGSSYFGNAAKGDPQDNALLIESVFRSANIDLNYDRQIHQRIWEKVAFNAGMNALCALSHGKPKHIERSPGAKELARDVADEVAQVAHSQSIVVDTDRVYDMIQLSYSQHGNHVPSMLQDLHSGRRTEVDALNGAVANMAEKSGVAAPLNTMLTTLMKLAELAHQQSL